MAIENVFPSTKLTDSPPKGQTESLTEERQDERRALKNAKDVEDRRQGHINVSSNCQKTSQQEKSFEISHDVYYVPGIVVDPFTLKVNNPPRRGVVNTTTIFIEQTNMYALFYQQHKAKQSIQ